MVHQPDLKYVTEPYALEQLVSRLGALRPDSPRRWGTLTPGEMLCHLGDAAAGVLNRPQTRPGRRRPLIKWLGLYSWIPWPHGVNAPRDVDPRADGTRPGDFEQDRRRAIETLRALAAAPAASFAANHSIFGRMTARDWHRWAYRHTDYHLKQFGL